MEMDELQLVQLVAPHADVLTIKMVRDRATKACKGYGFIEVPDRTQAQNAITELNGLSMGDRVLTLNMVPDATVSKPARNTTSAAGYRKVERRFSDQPGKRPRRPRLS